MSLSIGIVGLPNVGKSTLFNALLKKQVAEVANYPFCTIQPNVGVVGVPDERLAVLAKIVNTQKIVPAAVEFVDIAGLVKGASKGEGLGNQFLANIREVSVILHVVRFFEDSDVAHVTPEIRPLDDVETINSELLLADLQTLEKQKEPKGKVEKEDQILWETVGILKKEMNHGKLAKDVVLDKFQKEAVKRLFLLTDKPVIYSANVGEVQLEKRDDLQKTFPYKPVIFLSAKMEQDLAVLSETEQKEYLKGFGLQESGLDRLIKLAYRTLNLMSFLTAGEIEARAWTITRGMPAKEAAGVIHSDFSKNFIKADVISYEEFVKYGGWVKAREQGKVRSEGRDYLLKDGEVVEFKIGK